MPKLGSVVGLPAYAFDTKTDRYRNLTNGQLVKRADIEELLRGVTESAAERMARLGAACNEGQLSDEAFILALQTEQRRTGAASAAMAAGGWDRMTPADWGSIGAWTREQNKFLLSFYEDLQNPDKEWREGEIEQRAAMYADASFTRYWDKLRRDLGKGARGHWQTVGHDEKVCEKCLALEALGIVLLSDLPLPGGVHLKCRCSIIPEHIAQERAEAAEWALSEYGTKASGNWGHAGVKGQHGGSAPGGGVVAQGKDLTNRIPDRLPDEKDLSHGDPTLWHTLEEQGFTGRPEQVDDLADLISDGNTPLVRGCTSEAYAEQFRSGELYAARGMYGNGSYTSTDIDKGLLYADNKPKQLIEMVIRKDAKIIKYEDLEPFRIELEAKSKALSRAARKENDEARSERLAQEADYWKNIARDAGSLAAAKGYDAIIAKPNANPADKELYYVILNRTALIVKAGV